jgi:hypothetical protein
MVFMRPAYAAVQGPSCGRIAAPMSSRYASSACLRKSTLAVQSLAGIKKPPAGSSWVVTSVGGRSIAGRVRRSEGRHRRGGRELDNRKCGRRPRAVPGECSDESLLISVPYGGWPGVRRAGLPRESPALTPGQRRRRRRLDPSTARFGSATTCSTVLVLTDHGKLRRRCGGVCLLRSVTAMDLCPPSA